MSAAIHPQHHPSTPQDGCARIAALLLRTLLHLTVASLRLVLSALAPLISVGLIAVALAGVAIALFFGALLHAPHFHAAPILAISALCLAGWTLLAKGLDALGRI